MVNIFWIPLIKMASNSDKKLISQKLLPKRSRLEKLKKEDAPNKMAEMVMVNMLRNAFSDLFF